MVSFLLRGPNRVNVALEMKQHEVKAVFLVLDNYPYLSLPVVNSSSMVRIKIKSNIIEKITISM